MEIIEDNFSGMLRSRGFVCRNNAFEWHKLKDDMIYCRLWFKWWEATATVKVYYYVSTVCDEIELEELLTRTVPNRADFDFLKLIGAPNLIEYYPNSFGSGEEALNWKLSRLKCQLYYVVFPYFDKFDSLEALSGVDNGNVAAAVLSGKTENIPERLLMHYDLFAKNYISDDGKITDNTPAELSNKGFNWKKERNRILSIGFYNNDMDYIRDYFDQCREYNLALLKKEIPELFK